MVMARRLVKQLAPLQCYKSTKAPQTQGENVSIALQRSSHVLNNVLPRKQDKLVFRVASRRGKKKENRYSNAC